MPITMPPGTFLSVSTAVMKKPAMARSTSGFVMSPSATPVLGSTTMRPQFFMPMKAMKAPMPAAVASLRSSGTESMMSCRMRVTVRRKKTTPEMKTAARPACQVKPIGPQTK